jgi:hypothetical protein
VDLSPEATVGDFLTWYVKLREKQSKNLEKSQTKANIFDEEHISQDSDPDLERRENLKTFKESGKSDLEETLLNQNVNLAHSDPETSSSEKSGIIRLRERIESDVSDYEEPIKIHKSRSKLSSSDSENNEDKSDNKERYEHKNENKNDYADEDSENNLIKAIAIQEIGKKRSQPPITDMFKKCKKSEGTHGENEILSGNKAQSDQHSEKEGIYSDASATNDPKGKKMAKQTESDVTHEFGISSGNNNFQTKSDQHSEEEGNYSDTATNPKAKKVIKRKSGNKNFQKESDQYSEEEGNNSDKAKVIKKKRRTCKVQSKWFDGSSLIKDSNGDNIHSWLRRMPHSSSLVYCSVCSQPFSVQNKGFSAIKQHSEAGKHLECMKDKKSNDSIGIYVEKSKSQQVIEAELGIVKLAAVHNLSFFKTVPHLVKTMKKIFPDSPICQAMGSLSSSRLAYGLKHGVGKTEQEATCEDLKRNPFSLEMDGGLKGGTHRVSYLVHYYDEHEEKVVIKVIITKTLNNENAKSVADTFIEWSEKNSIDIKHQLIMVNSDHASVLRGVKTGATVRISESAPNVEKCDIGGDVLHDINNATKDAFTRCFPDMTKILNITKEDLGGSATKTEKFQNICSRIGLETTKPKKWCTSRFLSRSACLKERRMRILAYAEYYSEVEPPKKKRKLEKSSGNKNFQKNLNDSHEEEESSDEEDSRKPKAKKIEWIKKKLDEELDVTTLNMELAIDCLQGSNTLLKVFQNQAPMIHLIKPTLLEFTKESFLEITSSKNLKHSDGRVLGGQSLKNIKFETQQEKIERKANDDEVWKSVQEMKNQEKKLKSENEFAIGKSEKEKYDISKKLEKMETKRRKLEDSLSSGKYATLYEASEITLSKKVKETIKDLTADKEDRKTCVREMEEEAKLKKLEFYKIFCLNIQRYFPLDNSILAYLVYIDPKLVDNEKTEDAFRKICGKMSDFIKTEEVDEVISELRMLQLKTSDFGENYLEYCKQRSNDSLLFNQTERIDKIWTPIIKNPKYPLLGKFIKGALSFIHSTAFAEGSIKDIRNVVGSYSHSTSDSTCQARLALMSAIRSTDSCCFDYNKNGAEHRKNWQSSWEKAKKPSQVESDSGDDSGADSGDDSGS